MWGGFNLPSLALRMEKGAQREYRGPLEPRKGQKTNSYQSFQEEMQSYEHLDFCPMRSTLDV